MTMRTILGMALLFALVAAPGWARGIAGIAAGERTLTVRLSVPKATPCRLLELRPYQEYRPGARYPVAWEGTAGAQVEIPRFAGTRDRLYAKFVLVDKAVKPLGGVHWVDDLTGLPKPGFAFPDPGGIKGLQVQMVDDAIALGVKHGAINVSVPALVDRSGKSAETWEVDGERIHINTEYVASLDSIFGPLTGAGIRVYAILLNPVPAAPEPGNPWLHPRTDLAHAPNHLGAFNLSDEAGLRHYRAAVEYLAHRYSQPGAPHGWVAGYIVGNEVQAHWDWYNIGRLPMGDFVRDYARALRVTDLATRRFHPGLRTYASLEHHWAAAMSGDALKGFPGKDFLAALAADTRAEGDFPWHVAFHPYPEDLGNPRTWEDQEAVAAFDTPKITFRNIEVLPAFLRQAAMRCRGQARRIILSEQGFHTPAGPDGEALQAAGFAYAWHRISHTPGIDAFILHRHVDHKGEGGLRLGLWTWKEDGGYADPDRKKAVYEVFRLADTPQWEQAFAFAKPVIGIRDWQEVLPVSKIEQTPDLAPEFTLAAGGKSAYRIVIPERPGPVIAYAARELQDLLEQVSGARLPIITEGKAGKGPALLLGPGRRALRLAAPGWRERLREDGVYLRTAGPDVVLLGRDDRGQLYSVYVLLERYLGVRFLAHDCTVAPRREVVTLPRIDYAYSPPFMYRETLYKDSFGRQIATRQRLNGPNCDLDAAVGGRIALFPYVHSAAQLVPPGKYFAEHPEYFSLVGGRRTDATVHGQLCWTNPDVLKIATAQVLAWIAERPEVPIIDVSQNDGGGACECERCQAVVREEGSEHGPILRFVNAIADEVARRYPGKWIETLAYAYSTRPPAVTKPRPNVIIRLCHAGCYFHGFERCGLGASLTDYLQGWARLTPNIFIWHYATNFAHYLAPNPNLEGLAADIRYYAAHNVRGLMVQADYQGSGGELAELRQYLAAQLMWDPGRDPRAIRLEFCRGYYGNAARSVMRYLDLMDREARRPEVHAFGAWDPTGTVTPEFVARGLEMLIEARARADSPLVAARVGRLLLPLWYMQICCPERYGLPLEEAGAVVSAFAAEVERSNVTFVCEGGAPNMGGWLEEKRARYAGLAANVVCDLYLDMAQAERENVLDWRPATVPDGGRNLLSIFQHPMAEGPGDATYHLALPAGRRLTLRFATALTAASTDGVRFAVVVEGKEIWSEIQTTQPPIKRELDLTPWAGRTMRLALRVSAGASNTYDWANWVRPQVVREE